jgi:LysR family transcriptional regulator, transcriptional activator for dmlA
VALDLISCMRSFVAVVDYKGYANAARNIYVSPPVITKQIHFLEHSLKQKLFFRTTRRLQLTDAGKIYLEHVRKVLEQIKHAEDAVHYLGPEPQGHVQVAIPTVLHSMFFAKILLDFLTHYPKISCDLSTEISASNIMKGKSDIIISGIDIQDKNLIKKSLLSCRRGVYASASYLKKYGTPKTLADLKNHNCLIKKCGAHSEWEFSNNKIEVTGNFSSDSAMDVYYACLNGLGLMQMLSFSVLEEVRTGKLILLDLDDDPPELVIYIYFHPVIKPSVRLLIQYIEDKIKNFTCRL